MENYDAVQILASYPTDGGGTGGLVRGRGNYYARKGLCQEFLQRDLCSDIGRAVRPPDDGG